MSAAAEPPPRTAEEIRDWLVDQVAAEVKIDPAAIDVEAPLSRYGLDSLAAVILAGDLEDYLGRELAPEILLAYPSIAEVAGRLAAPAPANAPAPAVGVATSGGSPALRALAERLVRLLYAVNLEMDTPFPAQGPALVVVNHLHLMDALLYWLAIPRASVFLAGERFGRNLVTAWFLRRAGSAIFVERGKPDREALSQALAVLRGGGVLALAPEGQISTTGGLQRGKPGTAYLAIDSGAPVVPLAGSGQEHPWRLWLRLRRVPVTLRFGTPFRLDYTDAGGATLAKATDEVMAALARLLPPAYRGEYAESGPPPHL